MNSFEIDFFVGCHFTKQAVIEKTKKKIVYEIGREQVGTPVTTRERVCRLLLAKKKGGSGGLFSTYISGHWRVHIKQEQLLKNGPTENVVVKHPGCLGCSRAEHPSPEIQKMGLNRPLRGPKNLKIRPLGYFCMLSTIFRSPTPPGPTKKP